MFKFIFLIGIIFSLWSLYECAHVIYHIAHDPSLFELPNTKWLLIRSLVFVAVSFGLLILILKRRRKQNAP